MGGLIAPKKELRNWCAQLNAFINLHTADHRFKFGLRGTATLESGP